jgi:diamine N-acetyltransferase
MIDKQYQNQGYGREAMKRILEFVRTLPAGPAQYCWLSYKADNLPAKSLYESFGFRDNGEMIGDELTKVLRL